MSQRKPLTAKLFSLFAFLLMPLLILWASQTIWLQDPGAALLWMPGHPAAVGLFWLLCAVPMAGIYGFCRRLLPACLIGFLVPGSLTVIGRMKFDAAGTPLLLSDFSMAGKAGDLTGFAGANMVPSGLTVAVFVLMLVLLALIGWREKWRIPAVPGFVLGSLCLVLAFSAVNPGFFQNAAMALDKGCQDQGDRCRQEGMVLGLYAAWSQRQAIEHETFGSDVESMLALFREDALAPGRTADGTLPDIIFITSESFFDITRLPGLTFAEDPLPVYHRLSETCTNGPFLSNTFGGGTGGVEMEMFTGLTSAYLREGDTLNTLDPACYSSLPTTVRLLRQSGYATAAIHSHNSMLYNRTEIYPAIGFDETIFIDDFITQPVTKGTYVSDESFANEIIARYEARDPNKPCFLYGMSMENHQGYTAGKYGDSSGYPAESPRLSRGDQAILDALVYGLHDADASLGQLVEYFSQVDRPVLLVFVGDHRPSLALADGTSLYQRLGCIPGEDSADWTLENYRVMLSADYLIWSNYEGSGQSVPDRQESCTFLGLHTLERAGVPLNAYFRWLERDVASQMQLDRGRIFVDGTGACSAGVPDALAGMVETYAGVERGLLYSGE